MFRYGAILLSALILITSAIRGSPIDGDLYNQPVEEVKYKISDRTQKVATLDEPISYRLPKDTIPLHYDIHIVTNIDKGELKFTGEVKIRITVVFGTDTVVIHNRQTTIKNVDILNTTGSVIKANVKFDRVESHDFLIIPLSEVYNPGSELVLSISYEGELREDGQGFYWGTYTTTDGVKKYYGATQFEVDDARHAMPCYDEPGIRATMALTITYGKPYTAIANTAVEEQTETATHYTTKFATTPKIQSYLLAFAVSDYEHVNATNSRISERIFATPMAVADGQANFAAEEVGKVLAKLEEVLKVPFPLDKMDHIALTKFNFGAMENMGLITYVDRGLLLNPRLTETQKYNQQNSIVGLIAHEYAHQWFGNIVSPQWWQYVWLNEGFATLFANYIPHLLYPNNRFMRKYFTSTMPTAFNNDGLGSWAMNHYTEQPNELWDKFGGIGYDKSGCVIRMFMEVVTPDVFLKGLNIYLTKNYMTAATPAELHAGIQEAYNEAFPSNNLNIGELMLTWENSPGYPLITVSLSGSNVIFTQRRFPESNGEIYAVPLTIATKSSPNFDVKTPKAWLLGQTATIPQSQLNFNSNDWMVVNIEQVGYYRVNYDTPLWRSLIGQLNDNHGVIIAINRALLQDEFYMALTEFGKVNNVDALSILEYFDKEDEAIVWGRAGNTLRHLDDLLFGTDIYDKFLDMLKTITKSHLLRHGYGGFDGEDTDISALRRDTKKWNCKALDVDCLIPENQLLEAYLKENKAADFDWCHGMRLIGGTLFNQELNKTLIDVNGKDRKNFISYAGCTMNPDKQDDILVVAYDGTNNYNETDREDILMGLYSSSTVGLDKVLSFIDVSYKDLAPLMDIYEVMYNIGAYIKGDPRLSKFMKIVGDLRTSESITEEMAEILENRVAPNTAWMSSEYPAILKYFTEERTTENPPTTTEATTPTNPPATTPGAANSVMVSIGVLSMCILMSLKMLM